MPFGLRLWRPGSARISFSFSEIPRVCQSSCPAKVPALWETYVVLICCNSLLVAWLSYPMITDQRSTYFFNMIYIVLLIAVRLIDVILQVAKIGTRAIDDPGLSDVLTRRFERYLRRLTCKYKVCTGRGLSHVLYGSLNIMGP